MKIIKLSILTLLIMFGIQSKSNAQETSSLYDLSLSLTTLEGDKIDFTTFKGKKILFVNVASKCGFTPQYKDLQELHEEYKDKLVVIGLPCNQFGSQEPGSSDEIATFCEKNYGVEFLITEKIDVKGDNQDPLYKWLTNKSENGKVNMGVKWNFQKYLVDENGSMMDYFMSSTNPLSTKITSLL
jgi:glutathione peroxidase